MVYPFTLPEHPPRSAPYLVLGGGIGNITSGALCYWIGQSIENQSEMSLWWWIGGGVLLAGVLSLTHGLLRRQCFAFLWGVLALVVGYGWR